MSDILYIHGANSTKRSFAYLRANLKTEHMAHYFEYDTHMPCFGNIALCQEMVNDIQPTAIIGHSLGGIMAAYMTTEAHKITIAAPFGGSALANWLPMYSQLMRDVATTSPIISGVRRMKPHRCHFLSIVANGLDGAGFDGVVSYRSQTLLEGPDYHVFNLNHFEVLVDDEVICVIDQRICPPATS